MADDDAAASDESKEPSAADAVQQAVQNTFAQLTGAERLITLGALLVVVLDWIIGEWIFDEYSVATTRFLIPLGILAAVYLYYSGSKAPWHSLYPSLVRLGSWAMAVIGVDRVISWIRSTSGPTGATLFFELVFYAAAVLFAIGAWQMRGDSR